jgi:hypothetical protein
MLFQDISHFDKISDYLPIITAIIIVEFITIYIFVGKIIDSKTLQQWYGQYHIFAVMADVLSVFLGIIIARFIYSQLFHKYSIVLFLALVVGIQWIHDICFYVLFTGVPIGKNKVFDLFKEYAKSAGFSAILGDSSIMIGSVFIASILANLSLNANFIILLFFLYCIPYTIYMQ